MGLLVNIDNGGTLTDICAFDGEKRNGGGDFI